MARANYRKALGITGKKGRPSIGKKPEKKKLMELYEKNGMSIRDIANALACTKDMVFRCLKEYGIKPRENTRPSSLTKYELEFLEAGIEGKGLRGLARELKVDKSTLLHHIRIRKLKN